MKEIAVSKFKAHCLSLLDEVADTGEELVVTKRGTPVARVLPVDPPRSLLGTVDYRASDDELWAPIGDAWDAEQA